jgi:hypothetical protein
LKEKAALPLKEKAALPSKEKPALPSKELKRSASAWICCNVSSAESVWKCSNARIVHTTAGASASNLRQPCKPRATYAVRLT